MKTWLKVLIVVIVTAGLVGGVMYYLVNKKATADKKSLQTQIDDLNAKNMVAETALTAAQATTTPTSTATTDPTASWKTYTNTKYGFTLTFTDKWKGYVVKNASSSPFAETSYQIRAPTQKDYASAENGMVNPFGVTVYKKSTYDDLVANYDESTGAPFGLQYGDKLTENINYVATVRTWQDSPQDLVTSGLADEVGVVSHSLKFTN